MKFGGNKLALAGVAGLVGLAVILAVWQGQHGAESSSQPPPAAPGEAVAGMTRLSISTHGAPGTNHGKIVLPPSTPEEFRAVMQDPEAREKWGHSQEIARLLNSPASATPECRALLKIALDNGCRLMSFPGVYDKLYHLKTMEYSRTNRSLTINGAPFDPANPEHLKSWQRMLDHAVEVAKLELTLMKIPTNAVEEMIKIRPTVFYGNERLVGEAAKKWYTDEDLRRYLAEPPAAP